MKAQRLLSIKQVAAYLDIHYSTAWRWVEDAQIVSVFVKTKAGDTHLKVAENEVKKLKRKLSWLSIQECADYLGLTRQGVRYLCMMGKLKRKKVCYYWRITPRSLKAYERKTC